MESDIAMLRVKLKVDVAVAVFSCDVCAWMAMSGGWKRRPAPAPAMIWMAMFSPSEEWASRWMKSPVPRVWTMVPSQMASR